MSQPSLVRSESQFVWLRAYRQSWLLAAIFAVDAFVMGHAIGFGRTLSKFIEQPAWRIAYGHWYWRLDVLILSLACSQVSLLTIWACFSFRTRTLRLLIWLTGLALWLAAISSMWNYRYAWIDLAPLFLFQAVGAAGGVWLLSRRGYALRQQSSNEGERAQGRTQFSLEEMFLCLSVVAVLSAVASWFAWLDIVLLVGVRYLFDSGNLPTMIWLVAQGVGCGFCGCLAVWACLAERRLVVRMLLMATGFSLAAWVLISSRSVYQVSWGMGAPSESERADIWLLWFLAQASLLSVVLLVVRAFGWRLAGKSDQ